MLKWETRWNLGILFPYINCLIWPEVTFFKLLTDALISSMAAAPSKCVKLIEKSFRSVVEPENYKVL